MLSLIPDNLHRIRCHCARREISFLELVGSVARDDFDPNRCDIDVLVDFSNKVPDLFGDHVGLRKDLAEILRHAAHVITLHDVRNPLLLKSLRRDTVPDASAGACC